MSDVFYATSKQKRVNKDENSNVFYATKKQQGVLNNETLPKAYKADGSPLAVPSPLEISKTKPYNNIKKMTDTPLSEPLAMIRARVAGVKPNSEQKDCMILRFCWAMLTCGTCCT